MAKRDMDQRLSIQGDPEAVLEALLATDPEGGCEHCGHPMAAHVLTRKTRIVRTTCRTEGCDCRQP